MVSPRKIRQLWWLNPAWVGGAMGVLVSLAAFAVPDWMYRFYWRTPKFFYETQLWLALACTACFVAGAVLGQWRRRTCGAEQNLPALWSTLPWRAVYRVFYLCFWLSIAGYIAWAAVAASRGASLLLALDVLRGEKGASYAMKEVYLVTVSGVTTLTQFGIAALLLGVWIGIAKGWRAVRIPLAVLAGLTVARALFNSERLAIIELAIPFSVLMLRLHVLESPVYTRARHLSLQFLPLFAAGGLISIFGASEYFRSWSTFYSGEGTGFWQFVVLRLTGYYVTALNNGAVLISQLGTQAAPFFTLHFLWRFPFFSNLALAIFPQVQLEDTTIDPYMTILNRAANPEFNNGSGLLLPIADYGLAGAFSFWVIAGFLCGFAYRAFLRMHPAGLLFYPVLFTGVVEIARILYWGEGRIVTAYFVLAPMAWFVTCYCRRAQIARAQANYRAQQLTSSISGTQWLPSH